MNTRTRLVMLAAQSMLFGQSKRSRKAYEPCAKCGKLTKDEICHTCKKEQKQ